MALRMKFIFTIVKYTIWKCFRWVISHEWTVSSYGGCLCIIWLHIDVLMYIVCIYYVCYYVWLHLIYYSVTNYFMTTLLTNTKGRTPEKRTCSFFIMQAATSSVGEGVLHRCTHDSVLFPMDILVCFLTVESEICTFTLLQPIMFAIVLQRYISLQLK